MSDTTTTQTTDAFSVIYEGTKQFNDLAGNSTRLDMAGLEAQAKLIVEEAKEILEGCELSDPVKILDGLIDVYVTAAGLHSRLIALGFDIATAARDTVENNLSKFPTDESVAKMTQNKYADEGIETTCSYSPEYERWVIIDSNGKVRKPMGFVSNDLSHCVPTPV